MSLYRHLASRDRFVIYHLRRAGLTLAEIALQIGVHKYTVSREIRRNSGRRGYRPLHLDEQELSRAEYRLNHRPRKCLGWKTPYEVFYNTSMSIFDVALRT